MSTPSQNRRRASFAVLWSTVRAGTRPGTPGGGDRARALPAMVRDSLTGEYRGTWRSRLAVSAVGLLYLVSPVDVLPELLLPLVGMLDDAVVAAWVAGSLLVATEDYVEWREHRPVADHVVGTVVSEGPAGPGAAAVTPAGHGAPSAPGLGGAGLRGGAGPG